MTHRRSLIAAAASVALFTCGLSAAAQDAMPGSVLPGRPEAPAEGAAAGALDPAFVSTTAGISIRPPAGGKMIQRAGLGDEVVRFVNEEQRWTFIVSRVLLGEPVPLATRAADPTAPANAAAPQAGFADTVASQMPSDTPGKLLRSDLLPINGYDGALLASRFSDGSTKRIMQQAVIRRTDKTYYVITYTTPLTQDDVETDPAAARALETFAKIVDSVEILDQEKITRDQTERLIRTRALMVNWTPDRLQKAIVPQQWLRLLKDGKDIGYTYIIEELASDLPRSGKKPEDNSRPTGVRIGVRSRTVPEAGFVVDAESWMWVRFDRKQEAFRNLIVSTETGKKPNFAMELGTSVNRDRIVPVRVNDPGAVDERIEKTRDERIELQVWSSSNLQQLPAVTREVPPYYLSQALVHLLPRVLPLGEPRTYMFASYVPETRQVMTRYVDVLPTTTAMLGGQRVTATPVRERAGLEGTPTTHYLSAEGSYLGSVNEDNNITILATDEATLRSIWKDARLERPAEVDEKK